MIIPFSLMPIQIQNITPTYLCAFMYNLLKNSLYSYSPACVTQLHDTCFTVHARDFKTVRDGV